METHHGVPRGPGKEAGVVDSCESPVIGTVEGFRVSAQSQRVVPDSSTLHPSEQLKCWHSNIGPIHASTKVVVLSITFHIKVESK